MESRRKNACALMLTHMLQIPHVCEPLTLIRAAEGLTPCGRPPLHSGDGHSQPVNSPAARGSRQRATECGTLTKEMTATHWLQISGMQAQKDRHTHPCHAPVLLPPCSGTAAGLSDCQSHWWGCSAMASLFPSASSLSVFRSCEF